jgi:alginate O-acetyltransferase complex protein AlgI
MPFSLVVHYFLVKNLKAALAYPLRAIWLVFILTLFFYGKVQPFWLAPFFCCLIFDLVWIHLIRNSTVPSRKKTILCLSIFQNLTLLIYFKFFNPDNLPAGISFYTFESISLIADIYLGKTKGPKSLSEFAGFFGMFPRFVAGPIVRFTQIESQFQTYRGMQLESGLFIFIIGFIQKTCFADSLAVFTAYAFDKTMAPEFIAAWVGVLAYTFQIYFDFSGYSLMAIGLGRCFGFQFPTNFNRPYLSTSLQDFWKRWHISLSSWLKDYVYIPLGGNKNGHLNTLRNIFITMLLGGIWHGSEKTFLIWGAWHGSWLCLEKVFDYSKKMPRKLAQFSTFLIVTIGWVFFRSKTWEEAIRIISSLFSPLQGLKINPEGFASNPLLLGLSVVALVYAFAIESTFDSTKLELIEWPALKYKAIAFSFFLFALILNTSAWSIPFLYFKF